MSTARQAAAPADRRPSDDWQTVVIPAVPVRRSILRPARPGPPDPPPRGALAPLADWRGQTVTEELAAVSSQTRPSRRRPSRRTRARRNLRCALTGTLLAIVAISGLSAYAAQGVGDARSTAPCQAHVTPR